MPRKENVLVALAWPGGGEGGDTFLRTSGPKGSRRWVSLPTWGFLCCYRPRPPLHGGECGTEAQNFMRRNLKVTKSAKLVLPRKEKLLAVLPREKVTASTFLLGSLSLLF